MKNSQFKSLAQNMSVLIASVMMCHGNVIAAESPGSVGSLTQPTKESKAAIRYRKAVEDGCNDYALTRSQYMACNEQRARELPPLDPARREHFGELYDPVKFLQCKKDGFRQGKDCELHALRRLEQPEYWPYPDVPPMKWPDAPTPSVYEQLKKKQLLVTAKDYFEALCKAEAGEFVYRTVENVEAIYQIRPRSGEFSNYRQTDRYVIEAPYFLEVWDSAPAGTLANSLTGYRYFEVSSQQDGLVRYAKARQYDPSMKTLPANDERFSRFFKTDGDATLASTKKIHTDQLLSRYGFTWRGISRHDDRKNGIAGGELAIVELRTREVLAVKRSFKFKTNTRAHWAASQICPQDSNDTFRVHEFLTKVLKPALTKDISGDHK